MLNRAITNKYRFSFHLRRFVHSNDKSLDGLSTFSLKNSHTHEVSVGDSSTILSDSDIDRINNLAFFNYTAATKEANTKEGTLLDEKLANVKDLFGVDPENRAFINYKLPQS